MDSSLPALRRAICKASSSRSSRPTLLISHRQASTQSTPYTSSSSSRSPSSFIPRTSSSRVSPLAYRPKPLLPTFFTGRPIYENALLSLGLEIKKSQDVLRQGKIWPLPKEMELGSIKGQWSKKLEVGDMLAVNMDNSSYRRLTSLLNELNGLKEIARLSGNVELFTQIQEQLSIYERKSGQDGGKQEEKIIGSIDQQGRSLTIGRRKESSARVWMIKTKIDPETISYAQSGLNPTSLSSSSSSSSSSTLSSISDTLSPTTSSPPPTLQIPTTQILINSLPLTSLFPRPSDRSLILRPLLLTGLLGAFNIYAETRGGGQQGQAQAVAMAVARGVVTHRPEWKGLLSEEGMVQRDGRMVERKKTGLAKARKRYTWVKR